VARAVVATAPGLSETLEADWRRAVLFYARFEITEEQFRHGAGSLFIDEADSLGQQSNPA
jgi:hypothetical protein